MNDQETEALLGFDGDGVLADSPRVFTRSANDVAFMSPELLREKLRAAGYKEPVLHHYCRVAGCGSIVERCGLMCPEYQAQSESLARYEKKGKALFWEIMWVLFPWIIAALFAVIAIARWKNG